MVNHSYEPNAHYVQDAENGDIVLMKYDGTLGNNEEVTINYAPENGAAESVLKYGFIDSAIRYNDKLTLLLPGYFLDNGDEHDFVIKLHAFRRVGGNNHLIIEQNEEGEAFWEVRHRISNCSSYMSISTDVFAI